MRTLLLTLILFFLINLSAVLPIKKWHKNEDSKKEVRQETKLNQFMGSNLFDGFRKVCFSPEDVNLLVARRNFEIMIPKELPPVLLDDKGVSQILKYFYYGFYMFRCLEDGYSRRVMEKAFYDTLGGFMRYYLVPVSKFSYYASKVELRTMRNVIKLYEKCRIFLNTNANGWRLPMRNLLAELKSVKIDPINIPDCNSFDNEICCSDLDLSTASKSVEVVDDFMIISLPKIEIEESGNYLSNIWLPFSQKRTYNLRSCKSAFILVKFYRSVSRCYKKKSLPQKSFDRKFREWISENVKVHLSDDQFYPGLGGILNIYENTLLGAPADKNEPNTEDDEADEYFASPNEEDSLDLNEEFAKIEKRESNIVNEALLDLGAHKEYGDKNLNDWLETYNTLDDDEGAIKQVQKNEYNDRKQRRKAKKKCQLKYQIKYRKCKPSSKDAKGNQILVLQRPSTTDRLEFQLTENQTAGNRTAMKKKCKLKYKIKYKKCKPSSAEATTTEKLAFEKITSKVENRTENRTEYGKKTTNQQPKANTTDTDTCMEKSYAFKCTLFGVAELLNLLLLVALFLLLWKMCDGLKSLRKSRDSSHQDHQEPLKSPSTVSQNTLTSKSLDSQSSKNSKQKASAKKSVKIVESPSDKKSDVKIRGTAKNRSSGSEASGSTGKKSDETEERKSDEIADKNADKKANKGANKKTDKKADKQAEKLRKAKEKEEKKAKKSLKKDENTLKKDEKTLKKEEKALKKQEKAVKNQEKALKKGEKVLKKEEKALKKEEKAKKSPKESKKQKNESK